MSAELIIASNPSGRRKRRQSAKQRAASMRNLSKARRALGGGGGKKRRRKSNPSSFAPKRRRKRAHRSHRVARRRNPIRLPKLGLGRLKSQVMPALVGGAGAVGNDLLYNAIVNNLPATTPMLAQLQTGYLRHVGKAASAMLLAWVAGMVLGRQKGDQIGAGALTVVGYNVVKDVLVRFGPAGLNLGIYLDRPMGNLGRVGAYPGAGWNPTYGSDWRAKSGLAAYIPGKPPGGPGGVNVPNQFDSRSPFAMRSAPVYADEFESGT